MVDDKAQGIEDRKGEESKKNGDHFLKMVFCSKYMCGEHKNYLERREKKKRRYLSILNLSDAEQLKLFEEFN